jgi:hypothetical protein
MVLNKLLYLLKIATFLQWLIFKVINSGLAIPDLF